MDGKELLQRIAQQAKENELLQPPAGGSSLIEGAMEDGAETGTAEKAGVGGAELHRQVLALAAGDGCGKRSRDAAAHQQREGDLQGGCQQTCQQ